MFPSHPIESHRVGVGTRCLCEDWVTASPLHSVAEFGRIAQLARALPLHGRCRGFESLCAHRKTPARRSKSVGGGFVVFGLRAY